MDSLTFLIGAIAAGALAGSTEVGKAAVVDSYAALSAYLKELFRRRNRPDGQRVLEEFEQDPDGWRDRLREELVAARADADEELIRLAERVVDSEELPTSTQKYLTNFRGNVGTAVVGDHAEVSVKMREPTNDGVENV